MTIKNRFPLPIIDEILYELGRSRDFVVLDMRSRYHSCLMKDTLEPFLRKFVLVVLDDLLIYNPSLKQRIIHIELVLEKLS